MSQTTTIANGKSRNATSSDDLDHPGHGSRHTPSPSDTDQSHQIENPLNEAILGLHHSKKWLATLFDLAMAELLTTIQAYKATVMLKIAALPIYFLLYITACVAIATWATNFTNNIYYGFGTFALCQIAVLVCLKWIIFHLKSYMGFEQTAAQISRLKNDLTKSDTKNKDQ